MIALARAYLPCAPFFLQMFGVQKREQSGVEKATIIYSTHLSIVRLVDIVRVAGDGKLRFCNLSMPTLACLAVARTWYGS